MPDLITFKKFAKLEPSSSERLAKWTLPDDSTLQSNLDLAQKNILTKLGGPAQLPDDPAVDRSVYLLAQFYTENTTTQEVKTIGDLDSFKKERTEYYRDRVFNAINREVDNLIRPFVDVLRFMPGGSV